MQHDDHGAHYLPTPDEIAQRAEVVRRDWGPTELRRRGGVSAEVEIPQLSSSGRRVPSTVGRD